MWRTSAKISSTRSICSSVCVAMTLVRSRAWFGGTAGDDLFQGPRHRLHDADRLAELAGQRGIVGRAGRLELLVDAGWMTDWDDPAHRLGAATTRDRDVWTRARAFEPRFPGAAEPGVLRQPAGRSYRSAVLASRLLDAGTHGRPATDRAGSEVRPRLPHRVVRRSHGNGPA